MHPDLLSRHSNGCPPYVQGWKLPGAEKSLSKAGSGQAGHPFVLCPGDWGVVGVGGVDRQHLWS